MFMTYLESCVFFHCLLPFIFFLFYEFLSVRYTWTGENDARIHGLAERLREQFNTGLLNARNSDGTGYYRTSTSYSNGNLGNGVTCTTECRLQAGSTGKTQQELDAIAHDMTNQIVSELQTGKLHRSQVNQPNWFEHRVAERLGDLQQTHKLEFERNLQSVANRFHQQHQSNSEYTNLQQHIQQPIFTQQQQQQQGNYFQQQSQSQRHFGYVQPPPIVSGNTYEKVTEEHHKSNSRLPIYPMPVTTILNGATILQENCTNDQGIVFPQLITNRFNQLDLQNQHQISGVRPVVGGGQSYHVVTKIQRNENRVAPRPVIIPAQNSYRKEIEEERREVHRHEQQPIIPQVISVSQQNRTENREEVKRVVAPAPVPVVQQQHHIFNRIEESELVPNYRPRVVIDKNTEFHELEVKNHHREQRPVVVPVVSGTTSTTVHEEQHIDRNIRPRPVYRPTVTTTTVTKEEEDVKRQQSQRPIIQYPTQTTITQNENEVSSHHHTSQPQYPIFSHHTQTTVRNETHGGGQTIHTHYPRPPGQTTTTIKETHYVHVLPQPANQYTIQYTEQEYSERLNRIQQELQRLGYGQLTEDEYNATIASGGFIHNGYKYLYNADRGRYEKTQRVEINEEEYLTLLRRLQSQLRQYGLEQMTENEYNRTIENGYFVRNGDRYIYDSESGHYQKEQISDELYTILRHQIQNELARIGWDALSEYELNQTIATGHIVINGHNYVLNKDTGQLIQGSRVEINEQEYRTILRRLQDQLRRLGFEQMTEREYNQTISTGYFVRGGNKYRYNADIGIYERVEITQEEYNVILTKLQDTLHRLNYRQMGEREINETIATGTFIRGGYQWTYNTETGEANAIRIAAPFEEISESEYRAIYRHLQGLLTRLGYPQISDYECNQTISSGVFVRGGNEWEYQPAVGEFIRKELTETERNFRVARLNEALARLNIQKTSEEIYEIINRGNFYHGGQRYEYDVNGSRQFVLVQMTEGEYRQRVRQLLDQLQRIGYGTMTESECRATINSGVFYYGGHEWVYNHNSGQYDMGKASNKENGIVDDNFFNTIAWDLTNYTSSNANNNASKDTSFDIDKGNDKGGRKTEVINRNRGDQPPQTFVEDYEDSEELVVEPTTPKPLPRPRPQPAPFIDDSSRNQQILNQRTETVYPIVAPVDEEYERHYHRKQTTYTQTSGIVSLIRFDFGEKLIVFVFKVPFEVRSRKRKSGSTAIETDIDQPSSALLKKQV